MNKNIGLIVFKDPEEILRFQGDFDFTVSEKGYLQKGGKTITCHCCTDAIKKSNLGTILPGSSIFYCDNPACLAEYVSVYLGG